MDESTWIESANKCNYPNELGDNVNIRTSYPILCPADWGASVSVNNANVTLRRHLMLQEFAMGMKEVGHGNQSRAWPDRANAACKPVVTLFF